MTKKETIFHKVFVILYDNLTHIHSMPIDIGYVWNTSLNVYISQKYYIQDIKIEKNLTISISPEEVNKYIDNQIFKDFIFISEQCNEILDLVEFLKKFTNKKITGSGKLNCFFNIIYDGLQNNMINITKYKKHIINFNVIYANKKEKFVAVGNNKNPIISESLENIIDTLTDLITLKNSFKDNYFINLIYDLQLPNFSIVEFDPKFPIMSYIFYLNYKKDLIEEYIKNLKIKEPKIENKKYNIEDFFNTNIEHFKTFKNYINLFKNKQYKKFIEENKKFKLKYPNYKYIFELNEKITKIINTKKSFNFTINSMKKIQELLNFYIENKEYNLNTLYSYTICSLILEEKNNNEFIKEIDINENILKNIRYILNKRLSDTEKFTYFLLWLTYNPSNNKLTKLKNIIQNNKIDWESELVNIIAFNIAIWMINKNQNIKPILTTIKIEQYKDKLSIYHTAKKLNKKNYNEWIKMINEIQKKHSFTEIDNFIIEIYKIIMDLKLNYGNLKYPINENKLSKLKKFLDKNRNKISDFKKISNILDLYHNLIYRGNCKNIKCITCKEYISDNNYIKEKEDILNNFINDFSYGANIQLSSMAATSP